MSEAQQSVTNGASNPVPAGFDALPVLDIAPQFHQRGQPAVSRVARQGTGLPGRARRRTRLSAPGPIPMGSFGTSGHFRSLPTLRARARSRGRDQDRHIVARRPAKAHAGEGPDATGLHPRSRERDGAAHAGNHPQAHRRHLVHGKEREFLHQFALPLPSTVMSGLLGVDASMMETFSRWAGSMIGGDAAHAIKDEAARKKRYER